MADYATSPPNTSTKLTNAPASKEGSYGHHLPGQRARDLWIVP
jgi:hypothetical protein